MSEHKVSVIIPLYNASEMVEGALNSVLAQTIDDLEIVCIDDGSEDNTVEVVKRIQEKHSKIVLIHQSHRGAGFARNIGIENAGGQFIAFLDADDEYVDSNALEIMVSVCVNNHALICGSERIVSVDGNEENTDLFLGKEIPERGCFIRFSEFQHDYDYQSFIFERKFLIENQIRFPNYMRYQDPPFFLRAMHEAKEFYVVPVVLYKYRFDSSKYYIMVKHINHILQGIRDTLIISMENQYRMLFQKIRQRVNDQYKDAILLNMSDESMSLLLEINQISKSYDNTELELMTFIYKSLGNLGSSCDFIKKISYVKQIKGKFRQYFEKYGLNSVAVYGLGKFGKILIGELLENDINIKYGIDRRITEYMDIKIFSPDEKMPKCDALIVSLLEPEEIVKELRKTRDIRIYSFREIIEEIIEEDNLLKQRVDDKKV